MMLEKDKSLLAVKQNLELHTKHDRLHLNINIGDKVKIYTKKKRFDKERKSVWSSDSYDVSSARVKPCMRHEILKL